MFEFELNIDLFLCSVFNTPSVWDHWEGGLPYSFKMRGCPYTIAEFLIIMNRMSDDFTRST